MKSFSSLAGDSSEIHLSLNKDNQDSFNLKNDSIIFPRSKTLKESKSKIDNDIEYSNSNQSDSSKSSTGQDENQSKYTNSDIDIETETRESKFSAEVSNIANKWMRLVCKLFIIGVKHPEIGSRYKAVILDSYPIKDENMDSIIESCFPNKIEPELYTMKKKTKLTNHRFIHMIQTNCEGK